MSDLSEIDQLVSAITVDEQEICFTDLVFPPDTIAAWIHAAYRRLQGLKPFPSSMAPGWRPDCL